MGLVVLAETTTSSTATKVSYILNKCICCKQQFNGFTSSFINNQWVHQINFESLFIRTYRCKTLLEFEISFQKIFIVTFWILKIKQKNLRKNVLSLVMINLVGISSSHHVKKLIHHHSNCHPCHHKQRCQRQHWCYATEITQRFYMVKFETKSRFLSFVFLLFFVCLLVYIFNFVILLNNKRSI